MGAATMPPSRRRRPSSTAAVVSRRPSRCGCAERLRKTGIASCHADSVAAIDGVRGAIPAVARVTAAGLPGWTVNSDRVPPACGCHSDGAWMATPAPPSSSSTLPNVRSEPRAPGQSGAVTVTATSTSSPSARSRRISSGPWPSSSASSTISRASATSQTVSSTSERGRYRRETTRASGRTGRTVNAPPRSTSRIENSNGVEFDPRPAEPRHVAVGVDERRGPRVSEQRVLSDRMLHRVSLDHARSAVRVVCYVSVRGRR